MAFVPLRVGLAAVGACFVHELVKSVFAAGNVRDNRVAAIDFPLSKIKKPNVLHFIKDVYQGLSLYLINIILFCYFKIQLTTNIIFFYKLLN